MLWVEIMGLRWPEEIVSLLLKNGPDINAVGDGKYGTALAAAAYHGKQEIVLLLLKKGADMNAVADQYGTVLAAAAVAQKKDLMLLLLHI